jgi:hypothetical protein
LLVGRIFCDLAKAFDFSNHDNLLLKLNWYGITVRPIIGLNHTLWGQIAKGGNKKI